MADPGQRAGVASTRQSRKPPLGRFGRLLRFPWGLLFLIVFIAALLVLIPATTFGALAAAGGDWEAPWHGARFWTHATISQVAFAGVPFCLLLIAAGMGALRMLPGEVRLWRSRMSERGRHVTDTDQR